MLDLPAPPYFAVVFTSRRTELDKELYDQVSDELDEHGKSAPGFLGIQSRRNTEGYGVTVSYWRDMASIQAWRQDAEHRAAKANGRSRWYDQYRIEIARVETAHTFIRDETPS